MWIRAGCFAAGLGGDADGFVGEWVHQTAGYGVGSPGDDGPGVDAPRGTGRLDLADDFVARVFDVPRFFDDVYAGNHTDQGLQRVIGHDFALERIEDFLGDQYRGVHVRAFCRGFEETAKEVIKRRRFIYRAAGLFDE